MKAKFNIKPVYIATIIICFMVLIVGIVTTKSINNNNNQNTLAVQQIMQDNNTTTQNKLDGLKDDHIILGQDNKILASKIDVLSTDLGLLKEDVLLLQENVISLGLQVEDNQQAVLIQLEGLKTSLDDVRKQQGYANVTAKQLLAYNRCVASGRSNCSSILD